MFLSRSRFVRIEQHFHAVHWKCTERVKALAA
jgi:hypothetical protein